MREYVTVSNTPMGEWFGEIAILDHDQVLGRTREVTRANLPFLERVIGLDKGPRPADTLAKGALCFATVRMPSPVWPWSQHWPFRALDNQ